MAEKNASKTSMYQINVDKTDLGKIRSSGIIISTGSGSSGWLYGAKRVTNRNVNDIIQELIVHADRGECNLGDRIREQS